LLGEPVELVQAETIPLEVIARAEIVLEGWIYEDRLVEDGPFGEYTGYYGRKQLVPVMEITALTHRRDAFYHDIFASHPDHYVDPLATEAHVYRAVKQFVPSVVAVHRPRCGSLYHAYVSIKKRVEGQGKTAGLAALSCHPNLKHVIVVDDDVDVRNEHEVLWAVATRFQADVGLTMVPNATGATLDPTAYGEDRSSQGTMTTKLIIDATKPLHGEFPARVRVPAEVLERINLEALVPGKQQPSAHDRAAAPSIDWWTTTRPGGERS
jgi:2,5-furandicarboxylate decarboxylase 1